MPASLTVAGAVEGGTSTSDAPLLCGPVGGGGAGGGVSGSWDRYAGGSGVTRYAQMWVPAGATVTLVASAQIQPQGWILGSWKAEEHFIYDLKEVGGGWIGEWGAGMDYEAPWAPNNIGDPGPLPRTSTPVTWTNSGSGRLVVVQGVSLRYYGEHATWDVSAGVSGGDGSDGAACVTQRARRALNLESVGYAEDPVNTFTGSFGDEHDDLAAESGVFGLGWRRFYDSGGTAGVASTGFTFSDRLVDGPVDSMDLVLPSSRVVRFESDGSGGFERAKGFDGVLSVDGTGWRVDFTDGSWQGFGSDGLLGSYSSWDGQTVTATRSSGTLTDLTSSLGPSLAFTYDLAGRLDSVTSSDGRVVAYGYDANGFLNEATLPESLVWAIENDAAGRVTKLTDPSGVDKVVNVYDGRGRVVSQTSNTGSETTFGYDAATATTTVTNVATSQAIGYTYDTDGRLVSTEDALGKSSTRTYDANDRVASEVSRGGGSTEVDRNSAGLVESISKTGEADTTVVYKSDGSNRVESVTDANGTTSYTYDGTERLPATVTDPLSHTTTYDVVDGRAVSVTDADGVTVEYRYDALRRLYESEDELANITSYEYDSAGRPNAKELPSGARSEVVYDDAGRVVLTTAPDSGETAYTYNGADQVTAVQDPTSATTVYTYDPDSGLLATMADPLSRVTTYDYDALGNLDKTTRNDATFTTVTNGVMGRVDATTDELNRTTSYGYDDDGNLTSVEDPAGGAVETTYDDAGRVVSVDDAADRETTYAYDPDTGLLDSETSPAGTMTYEYDLLGRRTLSTDLRGGETETSYTPGGRVDWVDDPLNHRTDYAYDTTGRLATVTAPGGLATTYAYNDDSLIDLVTTPGGLETATTYDPVGRALTVTDPAGVVTTNTWSLRGELLTRATSGAGTVEWSYDPAGQLSWVDDALNKRTSFTYDDRGHELTRTDPNSEVWATAYNDAGEKASETDPLNRTTAYTYDDAGRVESTSDPSGRVVTNTYTAGGDLTGWTATRAMTTLTAAFGYDAAGRRTTSTIGAGTWTKAYDAAGDVTSATNPDGRTMGFGYDAAGRRTSMRNPDGTGYAYAYDTAGRVDTITPSELVADTFTAANGSVPDTSKWANVSSTGGTVTINSNKMKLDVPNTSGAIAGLRSTVASATGSDQTFTYQLTSASTPSKLRAYGRHVDADNNYRVEITADSTTGRFYKVVAGTTTQIGTFTVASDTNAHRLRFQVDGTNLRVKIWNPTEPEPSSWTASVTDSSVTAAGTTRLQIARSTGVANTATIDDWTHHDPNTSLVPVASYDWDADNNLTGEDFPGSSSRDWTWVDGQLTGFAQTAPGANRSTTLTYDTAGRLATEATSGVTTTYSYDNAGQLLSSTPSTGTANAWTYDNAGRRATQTIGAVSTAYVYDDAGELTSATPSTGTATSYAYDSSGRRLTDTTGSNVTSYGYDNAGRLTGLTLPGGDTQVRGLNPDGMPETVTNTVSATTTNWTLDWDPTSSIDRLATLSQGSATTDLVAAEGTPWGVASKGSSHTVLAADTHGSTITSTGATLSRSNTYNAYGTPTGTDTLTPKLGYRGELALGSLLNLRARDYQPAVGAFTTTDPLNGLNGTAVLNNPYHYTNNNPLNLTDPTGLRPNECDFARSAWACEHRDAIITASAIALGVAVAIIVFPIALAAYGTFAAGVISAGFSGYTISATDQYFRTGTIDPWKLAKDTAKPAAIVAATAIAGEYVVAALAPRLAPAAEAAEATEAEVGGANAVRIGQEGEAAVRGAYEVGPKASAVVDGRTRIFDGLNGEAVTEVKNVASQSYTQQLKDSITYAQQNGLRFDLYVRPDTYLTGPLRQAIADGVVNLRFIP